MIVKVRFNYIAVLILLVTSAFVLSTCSMAAFLNAIGCGTDNACCSSKISGETNTSYSVSLIEGAMECASSHGEMVGPQLIIGNRLYSDALCVSYPVPDADFFNISAAKKIRENDKSNYVAVNAPDLRRYLHIGDHARIKFTHISLFSSKIHYNRNLYLSVESFLI